MAVLDDVSIVMRIMNKGRAVQLSWADDANVVLNVIVKFVSVIKTGSYDTGLLQKQ